MWKVFLIPLIFIVLSCTPVPQASDAEIVNHDDAPTCEITHDDDVAYKHVDGEITERVTYSDITDVQVNIENVSCVNWPILVRAKQARSDQ